MTPLQELTAWSAKDIAAAVCASLPTSWKFEYRRRRGICTATFTDENGSVAWTKEGFDMRLLLFDAYGWLRLRLQSTQSDVWRTRHGQSYRPGVGPVSIPGMLVDDPQDLDPDEIALVYRNHLNRKVT